MTTDVARFKVGAMVKRPREWLTLGGRIRWMLDRKSWSGRRLARESDINETQMSTIMERLDNGQDLMGDTIRRLAGGLRVSPGWLLADDGWPSDEVRIDLEGVPPAEPTKQPIRRTSSSSGLKKPALK